MNKSKTLLGFTDGDAYQLIEEIDPDWRDHFHDPYIGIDFYAEYMEEKEVQRLKQYFSE